jgi:hypothetical protein
MGGIVGLAFAFDDAAEGGAHAAAKEGGDFAAEGFLGGCFARVLVRGAVGAVMLGRLGLVAAPVRMSGAGRLLRTTMLAIA